eukprot:1909678-Pleurochrysis_carterae.AAC.2
MHARSLSTLTRLVRIRTASAKQLMNLGGNYAQTLAEHRYKYAVQLAIPCLFLFAIVTLVIPLQPVCRAALLQCGEASMFPTIPLLPSCDNCCTYAHATVIWMCTRVKPELVAIQVTLLYVDKVQHTSQAAMLLLVMHASS